MITELYVKMGQPIAVWVCKRLTELLGFDASEEMAKYLLAMGSRSDLEEYLLELLNPQDRNHLKFIDEFLAKWRPPSGKETSGESKVNRTEDKKPSHLQGKERSSTGGVQSASELATGQAYRPSAELIKSYPGDKPTQVSPSTYAKKQGHKTKFVPLYDSEGKDMTTVRLPGRHKCQCQGHKHGLVNNCLSCGRIVCDQEGSGPCMFCGSLVCTEEELEILARGSKKGEKLRASLMNNLPAAVSLQSDQSESARRAVEHKDKLLHYDVTSARRTKVIDDESDYFATDSQWLSTKERQELERKKAEIRDLRHASRKDKKITLDFAGRRVIDATFDPAEFTYQPPEPEQIDVAMMRSSIENYSNPTIKVATPQFVQDSSSPLAKHNSSAGLRDPRARLRLQDRELQEVVDCGMCLSMHQPWASLLVAGIKMHEGRTWYSAHRGRLWIASTVQPPSDQEIASLEAEYSATSPNVHLEFPTSYPVGCLLGCVDVMDVLPQEEYREQYPDGESSSPYVFICENPRELRLKFPVKGKHKIYKLDGQVHKAARASMMA